MEAHDPFASPDEPDDGPAAWAAPADGDVEGDTEGDALDHLWSAAHEMLRAMRSVLDAADEFVASQRGARPPARGTHSAQAGPDVPRARESRVRRIDIDQRFDDGTNAI